MIKKPRFWKLSFRAKSRSPVATLRVIRRDGKPGLADFVRCVAASIPLRSAQNDRAIALILVALTMSIIPQLHADIPWPEVVQRLAYENEKLSRRPQGHDGEYFLVCTLYYTPKESGFTFERGFDATPITKPGLRGRKYPRDFLRSVKKEGFGRITNPVNGRHYIRYNGGDSYAYSSAPSGGGGTLVPRFSAAAKSSGPLRRGLVLETRAAEVQRVFEST